MTIKYLLPLSAGVFAVCHFLKQEYYIGFLWLFIAALESQIVRLRGQLFEI